MIQKIDINSIIAKCIRPETGELLITDREWNILYRTGGLKVTDEEWNRWREVFMEEPTGSEASVWEIADKKTGRYYSARSFVIEDRGERVIAHHLYDISDYAELFRDLGKFSGELRTLSACQSDLIGNLSSDPSKCVPIAGRYYDCDETVLYITKGDSCIRYYLGDDERVYSQRVARIDDDGLICCCSGEMLSGESYALYIHPKDGSSDKIYEVYNNSFKLYIENALLQEKIVYESEHDHLTGLYNKGKFSEMSKVELLSCESITVCYLDVNYLKRTNDTMGHEAGNKLLIKAADSMKAVEAVDVYAFRMGGDEFAIVALNLSEADSDKLVSDWTEALKRINESDPDPVCIIACGMVYGRAPYDLNELCEEADKRMYAEKRRIKLSRGDDPDGR